MSSRCCLCLFPLLHVTSWHCLVPSLSCDQDPDPLALLLLSELAPLRASLLRDAGPGGLVLEVEGCSSSFHVQRRGPTSRALLQSRFLCTSLSPKS